MNRRTSLALLSGLVISRPAQACIWDNDTVRVEKERFPTALELITGKFPRPSREAYEWRIKNRESGVQDVSRADDLAVAYEKTGNPAKAIEIMQKWKKDLPNRYETAANLGTFLIHSGRLEEGLVEIKRALQINPDAHFGRERWQQYAVEYLLWRRADGHTGLPLVGSANPVDLEHGFLAFLGKVHKFPFRPGLREEGLKGVLGMMRFGDHKSPVLLELLGQLLLAGDGSTVPDAESGALAARAFLKASREAKEDQASAAYRGLARAALVHAGGDGDSLPRIEKAFTGECRKAETWYEDFLRLQKKWVADGENVDEKIAQHSMRYFRPAELSFTETVVRNPKTYVYAIASLLVLALWRQNHRKVATGSDQEK